MHHVEQEADGGPNTLDNAIVLCPKCHAEAGHYNPRHPLGTKYSPSELRRHRDEWWQYCERYDPAKKPVGHREPLESGHGVPIQRREVGVLWSQRADICAEIEVVEFEGRPVGASRFEDQTVVQEAELFARQDGRFLVYECSNHRADWCEAVLYGAAYAEAPMTLEEVQDRFPALATAAGLKKFRRL